LGRTGPPLPASQMLELISASTTDK
jgi:hypothetical protein